MEPSEISLVQTTFPAWGFKLALWNCQKLPDLVLTILNRKLSEVLRQAAPKFLSPPKPLLYYFIKEIQSIFTQRISLYGNIKLPAFPITPLQIFVYSAINTKYGYIGLGNTFLGRCRALKSLIPA